MSDNQPGRFAGKTAVITGSSSGIGLAVARHFGAAGADVVVNSRSADRASEAARQIEKETGAKAVAVAADLRTAAGAEQLIDGAVAACGGIDILVNNAGISMIAPSEKLDPADWERAIATNLSGPFYASHAAHPALKARGGGVIVNIGSVAAHEGLPQRAAYCAAKHGLTGLTKVLAIDWAPDNIRVMQVDPAFIKTPLDAEDQVTGGYDDASIERRTPMSRFGGLDEVAAVTLLAAGPESSYMTGSCLAVDGGWMAYGYL
jgi:3-oxoacyl-[acyl-carrier protein] reductase